MELNKISLSRLQYLESGQFIHRFFNDFDNSGHDASFDPEFKASYDSLKQQYPTYEQALLQIKTMAETDLIMLQDEIRDKKLTTLRRAVSVFEHTDDETEKTAYKLLKIVLKNYKNIEVANFEAESLGLTKLIKDLRSSDYLKAVKTLNLENHIDNLEKANTTFETTFDSRSTKTISKETFDTKLLRKNIFQTYNDLVGYVVMIGNRKKTIPFYADALATINYGRKYYADILAKRGAKGGNGTTPPPVV
jgi:Family of unknown function (DUF6261)